MKQAIPWTFAALLAMALVGVYVRMQGVIQTKDAALQAAEAKFQTLVTESTAKLQAAQQRVETANQRSQQVATEAASQLQSLTTEANSKLQAANLPEVPVTMTFRKAMLGSGSVVTIRNTSGQSIAIAITAARPEAGQQRTFRGVIDAQQVKEIGHAEGWAFVKGDVVQVAMPNHKPKMMALN